MASSENNSRINENIFSTQFGFSEYNPFSDGFAANENKNIAEPIKTNTPRRLNGYDSVIFNQSAANEQNSEDLSIEYRIKEKESIINDLNSKIKDAESYGTPNEAFGLKAKRQRVKQELDTLRKQQVYGGRILGEKKSFSHSAFKQKMPLIYKVQEFFSRQILARLSKKVKSVVTLTDSLEQLSEISKSVDELIDLNIPYGEKSQNYEKLTEYLNRANVIHSKIAKSLGK